MFEIQIYGKAGEKRCVITSIEYNGEWMGECSVNFDVISPVPINFRIGDWLEYRGERFELHYEPEVTMVSQPQTYGGAYKYEGVKFVSLAEELVNCDFLDYVLNDNQLHFSGLPDFSFYCDSVKDLADRIQANMNRYCGQNDLPEWEIEVAEDCGGNTRLNISASNISCFDALGMVQSEFGLNFIIRGRKISIGKEGVPVTHIFQMGKDFAGNLRGLYEFSRTADTDQKIVTRLRAYGSERNLPRRYYNSLTNADGIRVVPDNMAINRLMLPAFPYETLDPYLDSPNIEKLGVIEDTVTFDGNGDLEEIFPSIEGATGDELRKAGGTSIAQGRLDEIVKAEQIEDNGEGKEEGGEIIPDSEYFTIRIKDIGFKIDDYLTDEAPKISFKTGMLGGRDFEICTDEEHGPKGKAELEPDENGVLQHHYYYDLTLKRVYDEGIQLWFPYNRYNAQPGDQFVILGIDMPDVYIRMASQRLLEAATEYLAKNDYARSVYSPKVDEIYMARQHQLYEKGQADESIYLTIKEGDMLTFEEESLDLALSTIFIDKLSIKEGAGPVPTYEITLREEKNVGALQRIQNQIDSIKNGLSTGGGGGYNSEQLRNLLKAIGSQLFLSKITNDATPYNLTVGGVLSAMAGVMIGRYIKGESGATITTMGYAELQELFTRGIIKSMGGVEFGDYIKGYLGAYIAASGYAELASLLVREDSVFNGAVSSPDFRAGFIDGFGWAITSREVKNAAGEDEKKYTLEIDDLIVRNTLRIFEMVVSQLVGENDNRVFSASLEVDHYDPDTGILWLDTQGGKFYNPFRVDDIVEVQQYDGIPNDENDKGYITKRYEFTVTEVGIGDTSLGTERLDWLRFKDFIGGDPSELVTKADTVVRMDNLTDQDRKGLVMITSVGSKSPYIDIVHGLKTDPDNALKGRIGNLQGLRHHLFGWLDGFGAYLSNLYAVGDFRMSRTGESIDTQLQILKERLSSQYSQIAYDIADEDNLLVNPSFTESMEGWQAKADTASLIYAGDEAMLMNGGLMITDGNDARRATLSEYEGRKMLYILKSGVRQANSLIREKMEANGKELEHDVYDKDFSTEQGTDAINENSHKEPNILYLSIKFLAVTSGRFTIGFDGGDGTLPHTETIDVEASKDWHIIEWEGTWNGEGDFILEYTGEMYVSLLSLTDDPLGDYKKEVGTRIEQTAKNIRLLGWNIDSHSDSITRLGIELDAAAKRIDIYVDETTANSQKIAQIELKAESIEQRVSDTEQGVASLILTAGSISARVEDVAGDTAQLQLTAQGLRADIEDTKGNVSALEQTASSISATVTNIGSDLSGLNNALNIFKEEYDQNNEYLSGQFSNITQTIGDISLTVYSNTEELGLQAAQIKILQDSIGLFVRKDNVIAAINLEAQEGGSEIKIQGDRITLEGATTITDYFKVNTDGSVVIKEKANIGGLKIEGNGLTNEGLNSNAYIAFWNSGKKIGTVIGADITSDSFVTLLARFQNFNESFYGNFLTSQNNGVYIGVQGARTNVALQLDGGAVQGFAMHTRVISTDIVLTKYDYNIICTNSEPITVTLPALKTHDNGHVVRIKRLGQGTVSIKMQPCEYFADSTSNTVRSNQPVISYSSGVDHADVLTGDTPFNITKPHVSLELVWVRDLSFPVGATTYHSAWVEYKLPLNW